MHENGITLAHAYELLDGAPRALPNHVEDGAELILVGPTSRGMVTIPIDPTDEYGVWKPRTGYPSKDADIQRYNKKGK
jgi:hypothetical protein